MVKKQGGCNVSRLGYGKDTELLNAVRDCIMRRLSYKEAVNELVAKGFKINEKKFQRIKAFIIKTIPQRLENLPNLEYQTSIIESIDSINVIMEILWNIVNNTKDQWQKMKAVGMILNCLVIREKFFESTPVVASISEKLKKVRK